MNDILHSSVPLYNTTYSTWMKIKGCLLSRIFNAKHSVVQKFGTHEH